MKPEKERIRSRARDLYATEEVAIYPNAKVDDSPDDGAWVEAWVWVPDIPEEDVMATGAKRSGATLCF
jgi:hypothetical protein